MENSIEEALKKLSTGKKIKMYELLRTFKREGIENFVITRKKYVDVILSDYKKVLKQNEQLSTEVNSLKKENETLKNFVSGIINENIEKDFIPVQKVKDKIEEVRKMKFRDYSLNSATIDFAIMKFRELLEKE